MAAPLMGATGQLWTDLVIYGIIALALFIPKKRVQKIRFTHLLALLLAARLAFYAFKIATGRVLYDYDNTYYYEYGQAFLGHLYPQMEYPTGALLLFGVLSLPAPDVETFRLLFPLLQLPFTILIIWTINSFGKRYHNTYASTLFIIIFSLSPAANWLWFHRYDDIAASILLAGLLFMQRDSIKGTLALVVGFTVKWVPILALPAHLIHWLKNRDWHKAAISVLLALLIIAALSVPFYLTDKETFTHTYKTQINRTINGESLYYAIEGSQAQDVPPYGYPDKLFFTDELLLPLIILAALGWLIYLTITVDKDNLTVLAALSLIAFIITNKIYSTQYIIWILPIFMIAAIITRQGRTELLLYCFALIALDITNFVKTPITPQHWLAFSRLFWLLLLGLFIYTISNNHRKRFKTAVPISAMGTTPHPNAHRMH